MVYCVECKSMLLKDSAHKVFKTGFYKTIIPLAHCEDCANSERKKSLEDIINTQKCYSDFDMIMTF